MSIIYTFECDKCSNRITTREPENKHKAILDEAGWEHDYGHTCRECRPRKTQECDNGCGSTQDYWTTGKQTKEDQLNDCEWLQDGDKWYCCDNCHRESIF